MLLIASPQHSEAQHWRGQMPELVGQGTLSVFFMDIYLLKLYSQDGTFSLNRDFVLEFTYKRPVSKDVIIEASLDEMKSVKKDKKKKGKEDIAKVEKPATAVEKK